MVTLSTTTVNIQNTTLSNNTASRPAGVGGGIAVFPGVGTFTMLNSTLSGNFAGRTVDVLGGGGIFAQDAVVQIANSTLSGNSANGGGGLISVGNTSPRNQVLLDAVTITNNTADADSNSVGDGVRVLRLAAIR
jgi:hypothetical protein